MTKMRVLKKKKADWRGRVTVGGFLLILFLPSMLWAVFGGAIGEDKSENRVLATMPSLTEVGIGAFPKKFEKFYNDHVPFRAAVRGVWTGLNVWGLHDSTSKDILIGKNDGNFAESWLFYKSKTDGNPVADAQGIKTYSAKDMKQMEEQIRKLTAEFAAEGRKLYYFVAPNKEGIYKEELPDSVEIYNEVSRTEKLTEYLKEVKNFKFAREEMMAAKDRGVLYQKLDTHWNELGALVGFESLMGMIEPEFKDFHYEITAVGEIRTGDLITILGAQGFRADNPTVKLVNGVEYTEKRTPTKSTRIAQTKAEKAPIKKKVMVIGDSYRIKLEKYLAGTFSEVMSLHRQDYKEEMMEEFDPDIVVLEFVERFSDSIKSYAPKGFGK